MANFGFGHLTVVAPYEPHWQEAKSAVGASEILQHAKLASTLAEAVQDCTLVLGTGTSTHRKPEQPLVPLNEMGPLVTAQQNGGRIGLVFGPEKHGLTREDLSYCHLLIEIPTDPLQPSMNLGQAAAVCLYEFAARSEPIASRPSNATIQSAENPPLASGQLDVLGGLIGEVMAAAGYSPKNMEDANRHDLRLMLRRLRLNAADYRRLLGLFRRILWRLAPPPP